MGKKVYHNDSKEQKSSNASLFIKPKNTGVIQRIAQHGDVRKDISYWSTILQKRREVLTKIIAQKSDTEYEHDFRFLLPLAHRLMEQGGFDKGNTELNNPYYLQSKGDEGFERLTKDEASGKETSAFGKFSTEQKGVEAYFERLENNTHKDGDKTWVGAYQAIMKGTSFQEFVRGLQPDGNVAKGRNYSTKYTYVVPEDKKSTPVGSFGTMMSGMKHRMTNLIQDFIAVNTYEIRQLQKEIAKEEDIYYVLELEDRIAYLEKDSLLLKKLLTELKKDVGWWKQGHTGVSVQ